MGSRGQEDRRDPGRQQRAPLERPLLKASAPGASPAHPEPRLIPAGSPWLLISTERIFNSASPWTLEPAGG